MKVDCIYVIDDTKKQKTENEKFIESFCQMVE